MKILVQDIDAHAYLEVFRVLEWRKGKIFRTQSTRQYIKVMDLVNLPSSYIGAEISAKLLKERFFEIDLVKAAKFGGED